MKKNICCFLISLFLINNIAIAVTLPFDPSNFIQAGRSLEPVGTADFGTQQLVESVDGALGKGLIPILKLLQDFGIAISFCVLAFIGIQFIIAPPQKKAELKAGFLPYLFGLLLLVAGVPIAITIINIFTSIF